MSAPAIAAQASREEVARALESVYARPEFRPQGESLVDRALAWLFERVAELFELLGIGVGDGGTLIHGFVYALIALALALALLLAFRFARARAPRARGAADAAADPEELRRRRVERLREEAREAEAAGDLVRALRLYFVALVIGLSERGELDYRESWTNRELFERGAPRSEAARELGALVPALDAHSFGGVPAARGEVDRMAALCDRWLGSAR